MIIKRDDIVLVVDGKETKEVEVVNGKIDFYYLDIYFVGDTEIAINKETYKEMKSGDVLYFDYDSVNTHIHKPLHNIKHLSGAPFYIEGKIQYKPTY